MWYDSSHIAILDPQIWYDLVADQYHDFHDHLDSFEKWTFTRFLPRDKKNLDIIDLWAGDWRLYKYLNQLNPEKYVACDISSKLLAKHPWKIVEKIVCDLEWKLPFENDSFDLVTSFFVLEHIADLENLFSETYRILRPGWRFLIWYFLQRREFIRKQWKEKFKIRLYNHRVEELKSISLANFFRTNVFPVQEGKDIIWYILVCEKN